MSQKPEHGFPNGIGRVTAGEAGKHAGRVPDVRDEPKHFEPIEGDYAPPKITVNHKVIYMSKLKRVVTNALKGKNLLGDIWMVALDLLPGGGALGELIKATAKRADEAGLREAVRERIDRMHWLKFTFSVIVFIAGVYAFIQGTISVADLLVLFNAVG